MASPPDFAGRGGASTDATFDVPMIRVVRKRDEKRERKLEEDAQPLKTSTSSGVQSDRGNYSHYVDKCEECKSRDLVIKQREGTIVCEGCGLVQQSRIIDDSSEWRTFSSEASSAGANPSRVGGKLNPYLSNSGIDTQVTGKNSGEI